MPRLLLTSIIALLLSVAGLSASEHITVYSARHYDADKQMYAAFTEETGIQVKVVEDKGDHLLARLRAEGANSPADVLITVDAGRLAAADGRALFAATESEYLNERIPKHLRHHQGHWFAFGKRYRIIAYAKDRVAADELSTYEDLADSRWHGRLLVRSSSNVYNQSLLASMIAIHGQPQAQEWAQGVVNNFARKPQGGDRPQLRALAAGEGDIAIVNHYYALMMRDSGDQADRQVWEQIGLFFPNQGEDQRGAHTNISGAGVLANAPNAQGAQAFLEWLASDAGQQAWIRGSYEDPVVTGITGALAAEGLEFRADTTISAETIGSLGVTAMMIFDRVGWR